jgi:hypothetical protein
MKASYSFSYDMLSYEKELMKGFTKNDLVLLYRKDAAHDWQIVPATISGGIQSGRLTTTLLLSGEYTLGICNTLKINELENSIEVFPNPTTGKLTVGGERYAVCDIAIFDVCGRMQKVEGRKQKAEWVLDLSNLANDVYFLIIEMVCCVVIMKVIKN